MIIRLSIIVVLLIVSTYAIANDWGHVITVDRVNGTHNDTMCINGSLPCATLNMALKGIMDNHWYNVRIEIKPGNYTLEYGMENKLNGPVNKYIDSIMTIKGSGMNETVINCEPSAGLFIVVEYVVTIDSISFHNCGYCCYNEAAFQLAQAAITMFASNSAYITIDNVALYNSNGTGILMIYEGLISSDVTITNSLITGGSTAGINPSQLGEGGIVLVYKASSDWISTKSNVFTINHSSITNNYYSNGAAVTILSVTSTTQYYDIEEETMHLNINSCFIMKNIRGLYYDHKEIGCAKVPQHINVTFNITNTQLSSLNNTSLIEMPDNTALHFDFIDVNITDFFNVIKKVRESTDVGQCYHEDKLTVTKSCSKDETCHFPEIDAFYLHNSDYRIHIIGPGLCSNNCILEYYKGHDCPIPYSAEYNNGIFSCWDNHQGELCGHCVEGYSVAINSPYLACVPCNDTKWAVLKGWGLLIVLEFIPVTVMVAVIAVLNVNLNQGSLKAYIFFCQILTIPFPSVSYPSWFVIAYDYDFRLLNMPLVVLAIWNLDFISYPSSNTLRRYSKNRWDYEASICLSHNATALGAIFFWYLIAFYPFILLFLLYSCVLAYDRGFRFVVCVMRPVHRLFARFWRKFNIQPSLPHTIASVYTLCFTQLAATSLKLLHFTTYDNQLRFFYDGSQKYFFHWHGAAGTLALIVLIVFIIVPVVYLSVYPFMWFQKCLNKVKIRKDLLISVTDVFTAPYSDGTQDTWDYRYYASSHFIQQLLVMVLYYIPSPDYSTVIQVLQICLCSLFLMSLVVFRPYRRKIHVFTEAILLLELMASSVSMYAFRGNDLFITYLPVVVYLICLLFFLISCCFCCVWFTRKCNKRQRVTRRQQPQEVIVPDDDQAEDNALLADRLINPSYYMSVN